MGWIEYHYLLLRYLQLALHWLPPNEAFLGSYPDDFRYGVILPLLLLSSSLTSLI